MNRSTASRILAASALTAASAVLLAACTAGGDGGAGKKATLTPAPKASTAATASYNRCVDDAMQVWIEPVESKGAEAGSIELADCSGVNVITSDKAYSIGAVKVLTIEGSNTVVSIDAPGVTSVAFLGSGNKVVYSGEAPKVVDEGKGNTITTK